MIDIFPVKAVYHYERYAHAGGGGGGAHNFHDMLWSQKSK